MRVLVIGSGGVGSAFARIAQRRPAFDHVVVADVNRARAEAVVSRLQDRNRFSVEQVDASSKEQLESVIQRSHSDAILNATDPRFNEQIFDAAFRAKVTYLDMAMTLSRLHPDAPYEKPGVMLGEYQLDQHDQWKDAGLLALVGMGVEPGLSDVFARFAADELFSQIDRVCIRDGANLEVEGYDFAPTFSIWTTIEECLNPPLIWERDRGFYTTEPFSEPEVFEFPEGIGSIECVNVEHEEVILVPRWIDCKRVDFKYGLGEEFIEVLKTLHKLGLDSTEPVTVGGAEITPRDVVASVLPDPATLGDRMMGKTCAGTWITGTGKDGEPRSTYLYHVVDNEETMREYACQAVVWQTAVNPVVALELINDGTWKGTGVLGPEAFPAQPFLDRLAEFKAHGVHSLPSQDDERKTP